MAVVALGRCTLVFHLGMAVLAQAMTDIFPGAEFLVCHLCIVAGITFLEFFLWGSIIAWSPNSIFQIMMAGSTFVDFSWCFACGNTAGFVPSAFRVISAGPLSAAAKLIDTVRARLRAKAVTTNNTKDFLLIIYIPPF